MSIEQAAWSHLSPFFFFYIFYLFPPTGDPPFARPQDANPGDSRDLNGKKRMCAKSEGRDRERDRMGPAIYDWLGMNECS